MEKALKVPPNRLRSRERYQALEITPKGKKNEFEKSSNTLTYSIRSGESIEAPKIWRKWKSESASYTNNLKKHGLQQDLVKAWKPNRHDQTPSIWPQRVIFNVKKKESKGHIKVKKKKQRLRYPNWVYKDGIRIKCMLVSFAKLWSMSIVFAKILFA